jgi:hypothetical protein
MRTLALAAVLVAGVASAASPVFHWARPVTPAGAGPNRLAVDVPLLVGAHALRFDRMGAVVGGLEDLRLYRGDGTEVPYLIVWPPGPVQPEWAIGRIVPITPTDTTSGFEVELPDLVRIDRVQMTGLRAPFLKSAGLEGSGDRVRWVKLASAETLFDLPEQGLRRTEISFAPEVVRYLRLTWDDRSSPALLIPASVRVRPVATALPPPTSIPLGFERRPSDPGTSRFRVHLVGPGLPLRAVELDSSEARLLRGVRVTEPALVHERVTPRELGWGTLRRVVGDDGLVAADLRVAINPPAEPEIEIVVDEGDNPALDLHAVRGELPALPWIYFESADGAALTAKFGARDLGAPRYDLEAMRESVGSVHTAVATWGDPAALPVPPPEVAGTSEELPTIGAAIDPGAFRYQRSIPSGPLGLTALRLDAAALAHSRGSLDLRIIDDASRQVPYVVENVDEPVTVDLPAPTVVAERDAAYVPQETTYAIALPYEGLPQARIVLETSGRVFDRRVRVRVPRPAVDGRSGPSFQQEPTETWRHVDPEHPAPPLTIALTFVPSATVMVGIDDADNGALPLTTVRLLLPTRRLRFVRTSDAPLVLAYGASLLQAPRYDLALLAPRLVGASVHEVEPGPEGEGGGVARAAAKALGVDADRHVFWGVLVVAVVVLLFILTRILRLPVEADASEPPTPGAR